MSSPLDPLNPLFFLSYKRSSWRGHSQGRPQERDRLVAEFFDELSENVAELVSRPTGADPGFIDREIPDGGEWTSELLWAVGSCQVFLPLLSEPYLKSEWCGKEWYAFSQREVISVSSSALHHQTAIIPVVWAPLAQDTAIPAPVAAVQRFVPSGLPDPDIAELYRREGLFGLMKTDQDGAYRTAVWRLAQRVVEVHRHHHVRPRAFRPEELRNAFQERVP